MAAVVPATALAARTGKAQVRTQRLHPDPTKAAAADRAKAACPAMARRAEARASRGKGKDKDKDRVRVRVKAASKVAAVASEAVPEVAVGRTPCPPTFRTAAMTISSRGSCAKRR